MSDTLKLILNVLIGIVFALSILTFVIVLFLQFGCWLLEGINILWDNRIWALVISVILILLSILYLSSAD